MIASKEYDFSAPLIPPSPVMVSQILCRARHTVCSLFELWGVPVRALRLSDLNKVPDVHGNMQTVRVSHQLAEVVCKSDIEIHSHSAHLFF